MDNDPTRAQQTTVTSWTRIVRFGNLHGQSWGCALNESEMFMHVASSRCYPKQCPNTVSAQI
eukprot:10691086-Alexandrium_andersonii.AAC.1